MNKSKHFLKGTSGTIDLVRRYGYDTKQTMHAIRILTVMERFAENGFTDYDAAIWFEGGDRDYLLSVKNGRYPVERISKVMEDRLHEVEIYRDRYRDSEPDMELKEWMNSSMMSLIRIMIGKELNGD